MNELRQRINQFLDQRDEKGIATYGQNLNDCPEDAYSWSVMLQEELLDGIQYACKANLKLEKANQGLTLENEQLKQENAQMQVKIRNVLQEKYQHQTLLKGRVGE